MADWSSDTPDEVAESNGPEKPTPTCGVRYGAMNWVGEFRLPPQVTLTHGAQVVVQTDRGIELGQPISLLCHGICPAVSGAQVRQYVDRSGTEFYRLKAGKVLRQATVQDVDEHQRLNCHVRADMDRCAELAAQLRLQMKVITAEHLLGGERIVFYFRSEGRVDFRELVRGLAQHYQTRIEMRQVGARDEARLIADYEVCGRQCCCKNFLKKLRPVTMRMAKLQKSTLDPSKVSGRCGRLRCCLRYEHEGYDELQQRLPRNGTRVGTEFGPATVIDRQVLTQLLLVRADDEREFAVPVSELVPLEQATLKAAPPAPDPGPTANESIEEQPSADQPEGRSGRRRRRDSSPGAGGQPPQEAREAPASEASPASSEGDQACGPPAKDRRGSNEEPSRSRRRRRRRPRRRRPDTPSGPDDS